MEFPWPGYLFTWLPWFSHDIHSFSGISIIIIAPRLLPFRRLPAVGFGPKLEEMNPRTFPDLPICPRALDFDQKTSKITKKIQHKIWKNQKNPYYCLILPNNSYPRDIKRRKNTQRRTGWQEARLIFMYLSWRWFYLATGRQPGTPKKEIYMLYAQNLIVVKIFIFYWKFRGSKTRVYCFQTGPW